MSFKKKMNENKLLEFQELRETVHSHCALSGTELCITRYLAGDTPFDESWKSLLFQLNTLHFGYRSNIKALLNDSIVNNNPQEAKIALQPIFDVLNSLKSVGLSPQSTPRQIKNIKRRLNAPKNPKRFLLQALERISLILIRNKKFKKIVDRSTLATFQKCKQFKEAGLKGIITPYSGGNLLNYTKQSNKRRISELVERVSGTCDYYQHDCGFYALGMVITASSAHHPFDGGGRVSQAWVDAGRPSPLDTYNTLQKSWQRTRSVCSNLGLTLRGLMTSEPNKMGVPHLNLLLFFPSEKDAKLAESQIRRIFLKDDKEIDPKKLTAEALAIRISSFPVKEPKKWGFYITKSSRGQYEEDQELGVTLSTDQSPKSLGFNITKTSAEIDYERIDTWHETWGIRRHNFFGQLPIYYWRSLQRLPLAALHAAQSSYDLPASVIKLWEHASAKKYVEGSNQFIKGEYSYRDFLLLTESTSIHFYRKRYGESSALQQVLELKNKEYKPKPDRFTIQIFDLENPHLNIELWRHKYEYIACGFGFSNTNRSYKRYLLQLRITLLKKTAVVSGIEKIPP